MLPKFVVFLWFVYYVMHYCLLVNRPNFVQPKIIGEFPDQKI